MDFKTKALLGASALAVATAVVLFLALLPLGLYGELLFGKISPLEVCQRPRANDPGLGACLVYDWLSDGGAEAASQASVTASEADALAKSVSWSSISEADEKPLPPIDSVPALRRWPVDVVPKTRHIFSDDGGEDGGSEDDYPWEWTGQGALQRPLHWNGDAEAEDVSDTLLASEEDAEDSEVDVATAASPVAAITDLAKKEGGGSAHGVGSKSKTQRQAPVHRHAVTVESDDSPTEVEKILSMKLQSTPHQGAALAPSTAPK